MAWILLYFYKERAMLDRKQMKEVINILMESASYFYLTVQERLRLVKHLMNVMT